MIQEVEVKGVGLIAVTVAKEDLVCLGRGLAQQS